MKRKSLRLKRAARAVLLVLLLCAVGTANALAQDFTVGHLNYSVNSDGTSVTEIGHVNGSSATGALVIPEWVEYEGSTYSVTSIGGSAFSGCSGFTGSLTIPNSVITIGDWAFAYCSRLSEIIVLRATPPSLGYYDVFHSTNNCPIYVLYESLNDYKTAHYNWSNYEDRIFPMAFTTVSGYGEGEVNYRFIASPLVENTAPTAVDNMITETEYDLYRFDQNEDAEWQNYKSPENTPNFFLTNGQGYLYANAEDVNLIFKGEFNEDDTKEVGLAYDANAALQIVDLQGRIIVSADVARNVSTSGMAPGLYVLRLVNGDEVRTQKMVV